VTPAPSRPRDAIVRDVIALIALLGIAAVLRLPDLATRGTWDADQGHDMLVLRTLVRDGVVPLLGPPTSIGDFHHGAVYYYLLAPSAALTGGDSPLAVTLQIALFGIAAVGVTWWLARSIAGSIAGFVAGLAMALSAAAVEESTFIWNPNLIALSSAVALAGAWRAWSSGRARWWLLAAVGTAVTMQCHVLGVTLLPVTGALLVADARRRPSGPDRQAVVRAGLAGLAIVALTYVPLVVYELTTDFSEVRAALDYLQAGGDALKGLGALEEHEAEDGLLEAVVVGRDASLGRHVELCRSTASATAMAIGGPVTGKMDPTMDATRMVARRRPSSSRLWGWASAVI
jgi:4-amino-4-deoxy-L-arabinose transferase-like glycosyltransferase